MRSVRQYLEILVVFAGVLLATAARARPPEVALLTDLLGRVEVKPEISAQGASAEWHPAALDDGLLLGDSVRTWDQSAAELRFVDGTMLMLSERTRVRITTALFNPAEAPPAIRVALAVGAVDVRAARVPLEVQIEGGGHHRVAPGEAAHIERLGEGPTLEVGPPRLPVSTDFAPPGDGGGPEAAPRDPTVAPGADPGPAPAPPAPVAPEAPLPPFDEPLIEPEDRPPPPTRVRVKVRVRAEVQP